MRRTQTNQQASIENKKLIDEMRGSRCSVIKPRKSCSTLDLSRTGPNRKRLRGKNYTTNDTAIVCDNQEFKSVVDFEAAFSEQNIERTPKALATMNCNSNGKTDFEEIYQSPGSAEFLKNYSFLRKVKHINMGEVPLHPMGLSLSGSGMQLFVKMDDAVQKAIMNQCAPKRKRAVFSKKSRFTQKSTPTMHQASTQTVSEPVPYSEFNENETMNGEVSAEGTFTISETQLMQPMSEDIRDTNKFLKKDKEERHTSCHRIPITKRFCNARQRQMTHQATGSNFNTYLCLEDDTFAETFHRIYQQKVKDNNMMNNEPHSYYPNKELNDNNSTATMPARARCDHPVARVTCCDKHVPKTGLGVNMVSDQPKINQTSIRGFTSWDLPLKRYKGPLNDIVGSHDRKNIFEGESKSDFLQYLSKSKYTEPSRLRGQSLNNGSPNENFVDDQEELFDDVYPTASDNDNKIIGHSDICLGKNNSRGSEYDPRGERVVIKKETVPARSISEGSSGGPNFDTGSIPSHAIDAQTLEKFTEYTQSMRKDLRENFKNLSVLMKEINTAVVERNKPEFSDESRSELASNPEEKLVKLSDGKVCVIM